MNSNEEKSSGAITKLLEDEIEKMKAGPFEVGAPWITATDCLTELLPQVRAMEDASIQKLAEAKQEEQTRIVGILEEMIEEQSNAGQFEQLAAYTRISLQEAIERISNNQ